MTLPLFTAQSTAALLLQHWHSGERLQALPAALKPETLSQGYDAQDQLFAAAGGRRVGWKLGVGSPAALRAGRLSRALVGQLDAARCHGSGVHIQLPAPTPVTLECEVAFVLAHDVQPEPGRSPRPEDIRATCVTFEVVRSRFVDRKSVGWPSFVADNVGFEALVIGEHVCAGIDAPLLERLAATAVVGVDGVPRARGLSGDGATDPLASLAALYAHAAERGEVLHAGDIVTTGAMCEPFDLVGTGHRVSVEYFGKELMLTL
ncbi:2-keto-4-pentenoate hydratase [Pseudomonas aegrilactucae]|uniref:Hydratase n=1 Tax=Pseudomonas aegrilactucae TaxID=2854028 RepID=A0A9Q3ADQ7_9PSED|nr:fumarylacetoacetate hydrolase family protein [Pseudomonas aegrilactucae]MBV6288917.1 hydratase [Pseudomonas aegrilactucae]